MVAKLASGKSCRRRRLFLEQLETRLNLAALSVDDAFAFEGHSGIAELGFTVTLDQASTETVTVNYFTFGVEATMNVDYAPIGETIVFAPGETSQTVGVVILGDTDIESDETFYFALDNPVGATLADNYYAIGTIGNDDSTPGNNAPIATAEAYELNEDHILQVYNLGVLANDYDLDGDPLQAFVTSGPAHGTLLLDAGGSFNYIPDQDYFGPDSFTYRARDLGGLSTLATVSLTVWGMDDPIQLAAPGPQTTAEDTPLTFSLANDNAFTSSDIESPEVMVALIADNGILTLTNLAGLEFPDPNSTNNTSYIGFYADSPAEANAALEGLVFTPTADFNGTANLTVMVTDMSIIYYQEMTYAIVPITVSPVNDAPVPSDDSYEGAEDEPLTVSGYGVLENDYDPDYDILSTVLVSGPAHGTVTLESDGDFIYTPAANFHGTDSFTYAATDPGGLSTTATATITVWPTNDPLQISVPGPQTIAEDGSITFSAAGNGAFSVSDLEAPSLIVALVVQEGILTLPSTVGLEFPDPEETNNSPAITFYADNPAEANTALEGLVFTPNANFNGQTYLSLFAQDTTFHSFPAQEAFDYTTITITPVNDTPVALDDFYTAEAGAPFWATLGGGGSGVGVLMNDQDVDMELITAVLVSGPAHGTLEFNPDGTFIYTADAAYTGTDSFTYRATDGQLESLATATFNVIHTNAPPVASNNTYSVNEDGVLTIAAPGVLGNDSDTDGDTLTAALFSGPSHGVLSLSADGSFTYTPTANYYGSDSFTYRANDGEFDSNVATVSITVSAVNDAPLAVDDAYSVNEDQTLTIAPVPGVTSLTMVSEPGDYIGQGLSYSFTPQTGTFMANRNFDNGVSLVYGAAGQSWNLRFAAPFDADLTPGHYANATRWPFQAANVPGLSVIGNGRGSNTLTGNFTVTQALYAADGKVLRFAADFEQHNEGFAPALTGTIQFNQGDGPSGILLNDSDVENSPLTIIVVSGPAHGTLSMNVDGSFIYTPTSNYNGADSFSYKLSDGTSESNVATVSLTVNAVNDFPTAVADSYTVAEDTVLSVGAPGVLANDFDVDGQSLTATLVTSTTHGSLAFNTDGSFTYMPQANYTGSDSFQYAARDASSFSFIRTVTLNVTSVNDAPVAANDSYTTDEDTPLTVAVAGVLANDSDIEGTALTAALVSGPAHGTLTLNSNGSFTYTPSADFHGTDSFTYRASDGSLSSNIATVSLTINAVNDAPTATGDAFSIDEDQSLAVPAAGVLANDGDVDGDSLSAVLVSGPVHGTLNLNADGSFTYTPTSNYFGNDSFTYQAGDGSLSSNIATVSLTINAANDAPTATDDAFAIDEDQSLTIAAPGVLANDGDVDGDSLSAVLVSGPAHGTLNLNADGSFTYTPTANYHGSDSFTYQAGDGSLSSNIATVSLTISAANDAPTATDDAFAIDEDQSLTIAAAGVLANDGDVDGDSLSAVLVSGPAHGTLNLNADGSFTYTPTANYYGGDSFTYQASDGSLDSSPTTVTLTIAPVNDDPLVDAGPDQTVDEGATVSFTAAATDADDDALEYLWDFGDGATSTDAAPSHVFADNGVYSVTLTVSDGQGGMTTATLVVTVLEVAPTLTLSGADTVDEASSYTLTLAASDPGSDTIASWTIDWGDGNVQTVTGNPGSVSHTYVDGPVTYAISATASDEDGTYTAADSLNVTVNNVVPTASLTGPATGVRGQTRTFSLAAVDPAASDQAGSFTFNIDWGDGSTQTVNGPASQQVDHAYTNTGTFTMQITATDKDGGTSVSAQHTIQIKTVDLQAGVLVIGGTAADDSITVAPVDASGDLAVTINGVSQGTFSPPAQIVAYGQAGNDQIKLNTKKIGPTTYYVAAPAVIFGDAGNDTLDARGSSANNILVGGAGGDTLQGGSGRDLLIGGLGADTVRGNGGDDLVTGNSTDYDANLMALMAIMAEWSRTDANYNTRINHLNGNAPGGLNGGTLLNTDTVHDEAVIDQLYGDAGSDWFFYTASGSNKDKVNDLVSGEVATPQ